MATKEELIAEKEEIQAQLGEVLSRDVPLDSKRAEIKQHMKEIWRIDAELAQLS